MHALGCQTNVGHHGDTVLYQPTDGRRYMPAPFQLDRLSPRLLQKTRGIGQGLISGDVISHERQITNDKGAFCTAHH